MNYTAKLFMGVVILLLIVGTLKLFPLEFFVSGERVENPDNCPYYITLQSTLASYPLIAADNSNIFFIKRKMLQFEKDINLAKGQVAANYKKQFYAALIKLDLKSTSLAQSKSEILRAARVLYPIIDGYYLDKRIFCLNPLYDWKPGRTRRILRYNGNGFYDQIPSKYSRILVATSTVSFDWIMGGSPPGFFVNNQDTSMDTRFMTGIPLLTALYVLPKFDFVEVGGYFSVMPWSYFGIVRILDPVIRKVINVGGMDVLTLAKADLKSQTIPGTVEIGSDVSPLFGSWVRTFVNKESYGMAYFANHIYYEDPYVVHGVEKTIKHYFNFHRDSGAFTRATNGLYQKLMGLKKMHDVLIELASPLNIMRDNSSADHFAGAIQIKGIVGERALFQTDCLQKTCAFVFNMADAPGWHAYVNGKESTIERVNYAFMATWLPQGRANVWFVYQPWPQMISYFVSILAFIGLLILGNKKIENSSSLDAA